MASYSFLAPRPTNAILSDIDHIREIQWILAQLNPSLADDAPEDSKRLVPLDPAKTQYRFERLVGSSWNSVGKLMHDVDTLDGYHASISAVKNTIPVYNADAKLVGDLTGNANTATTLKNIRKLQIGGIASGGSVNFDGSADATIEITQLTVNNANDTAINGILTVKHGGTGGADAATARANLGVPAIDHSSTAKTFGVSSTTKYGHAIGSDTLNSTFTADKGYFFSPKGADDLNNTLRALISQVSQEVAECLKLSGGTMTGEIRRNETLARTTHPESDIYLIAGEGYERISGLLLRGYNARNYPGCAQLMAGDSVQTSLLTLTPTGGLTVNEHAVLTSAGGTVRGAIRMEYPIFGARTDGTSYLEVYGGSATNDGAFLQLNGAARADWPEGRGRWTLTAVDGSGGESRLVGTPDGGLYLNNTVVITSAGGTMSGPLTFADGGSVQRTGQPYKGSLLAGAGNTRVWIFDEDSQELPGHVLIRGTNTDFVVNNAGSCLINSNSVITSAGGNMTAALTFGHIGAVYHSTSSATESMNVGLAEGAVGRSAVLSLRSSRATDGPGSFWLGARSASAGDKYFAGTTEGWLGWMGHRIVTGNDIYVTSPSSTTFTLPAGGTWRYLCVRTEGDTNKAIIGQAAGGTTVNFNHQYAVAIAIRIA